MVYKFTRIIVLVVAVSLIWNFAVAREEKRPAPAATDFISEPERAKIEADGAATPASLELPATQPEEEDWGVNWKGVSTARPKDTPPSSGTAAGVIVRTTPEQAAPIRYQEEPDPPVDQSDARSFFDAGEEPSQPAAQSGMISGYRGPQQVAAAVSPEPTGSPVPTPSGELPWVRGQARGYAMLYAMHPKARPLVEQQTRVLIESKVREPYISILVDGTFNQDFEYIKTVIGRIAQGGREPTVALYMTNGPTMRKYDVTRIVAPFVKMNPAEFRESILFDPALKEQFEQIVLKAKALFEHNRSFNPANKNIAIVMLEDNLNRRAYEFMREAARKHLEGVATFVRNPCVGCFDEFADGDTAGDPREEHEMERFRYLTKGDGYTLDGLGFQYPDGSGSDTALSADGTLEMMEQSRARELRYVGLWRQAWQGVIDGRPNPVPDERTYSLSTDAQVQFEISALRHALESEGQ